MIYFPFLGVISILFDGARLKLENLIKNLKKNISVHMFELSEMRLRIHVTWVTKFSKKFFCEKSKALTYWLNYFFSSTFCLFFDPIQKFIKTDLYRGRYSLQTCVTWVTFFYGKTYWAVHHCNSIESLQINSRKRWLVPREPKGAGKS